MFDDILISDQDTLRMQWLRLLLHLLTCALSKCKSVDVYILNITQLPKNAFAICKVNTCPEQTGRTALNCWCGFGAAAALTQCYKYEAFLGSL